MNSSVNRALIFQGGGSLGAYEAGAYKAIKEKLSQNSRAKGRGNEPVFHIIAGTSTGAMNAAILVSYVKENKTWEGSDERLVEFWEYLSTRSSVEKIPYFTHYWDSWLNRNIFLRSMTVLLIEKMTSFIMPEQNLMKTLQF
jgi:predicted acylesterase/phospholipase RssA